MRRLQKHLSLILLFIFVSISVTLAPITSAASGPTLKENLFGQDNLKAPQDYIKEYCDKRSGDLMNLETWYSGKCSPGIDSMSGDGVGFADIVILQGLEWLYGPQYSSFLDSLIKSLKFIESIKSKAISGEIKPSEIAFVDMGNIGLVGSLGRITTGLASVRPASSMDYLAYVSTNLKQHKIIPDTYAAGPGYGYSALAPILPLWRAFRNISYLMFAFAFVLYGMMIMFRVRIDSKTAATIQLAIPKLIATLIMITFSYAIVGLLVDLSTVATAMSINILKAGGILTSSGVGEFIPLVVSGQSIFGAIGSFIVNTIVAILVSPFIFFNLMVGGLLGIVVAGATAIVTTFVPYINGIGLFVGSLILFGVIISYVRLIGKLFQAFISIIVNLIFAPIILLGNLLPGSTSFSDWLKSIYGNLAVFPVACFFLTLSYALMCQPILSIIGNFGSSIPGISRGFLESLLGVNSLSTLGNIWTPPMTIPGGGAIVSAGGGGLGNLTGSAGSLMLATIGFGLLLMSSKYVEMVEKALKTPPFPYGAAIGEALKSGLKQSTELANRRPGPSVAKDTANVLNKVVEVTK